ncbi:MAG: SgcJ/EcaC family oxidoreductase [Planctomycetes bacterium]|nr:SgcJ/EcaC family oxidoreductase [Planctomycetota bacterium]
MRYKKYTWMTILTLGVACVFGLGNSMAQEASAHANDEQAIRQAVQEYVKAFNNRDIKAIVAQCTEDVDYIDETGRAVRGRDALAKDFERFFKENRGRKIRVAVESIQFVKPDVAVVDGVAQRMPPPVGKPVKGRYTAVRVKQDGKWLVASVREGVQETPTNYDYLKELEWMVGDWIDKDETSSIRSSVRWSKNKNFILRTLTVNSEGQEILSVTQRIGWDPARNQIKSWVFDSDGGAFEGLWVRDGNKWIVRVTGVLQDGAKASATNTYTLIDNDTFTFQSRNRVVDEEPVADIEEVKIKRLPPGVK